MDFRSSSTLFFKTSSSSQMILKDPVFSFLNDFVKFSFTNSLIVLQDFVLQKPRFLTLQTLHHSYLNCTLNNDVRYE